MTATSNIGALVTGADYRGLGAVRSLGRHDIPVYVLADGEHSLARASRYTVGSIRWPSVATEAEQVDFLMQTAERHGLHGWVLIPTSDEHVRLIAQAHDRLSSMFRLTTLPWSRLEALCNKLRLHHLGMRLDIPQPWTYHPQNRKELLHQPFPFPVLLKPALRARENALTRCKAWVANDIQTLTRLYDEAAHFADMGSLMVQELIPGPSDLQFSYAAVCVNGEPLAQLSVIRRRQFPALLGRASTFVEVSHQPELCSMGARLLKEVQFSGIAEVEFKYDTRQQCFKLLDVNPRLWGWHSIGCRAGIDFSYLLWANAVGRKTEPISPNSGVRWVRLSTDLCVAFTEMRRGNMSLKEYLSSFRTPLEEAIFAKDDLLPAVVDLPLTIAMTLRRAVQHQAA